MSTNTTEKPALKRRMTILNQSPLTREVNLAPPDGDGKQKRMLQAPYQSELAMVARTPHRPFL